MGSGYIRCTINVICLVLICQTQALLIVDNGKPIGFTLGQTTHQHLTNGTLISYNKVITHKGTGQEYASNSIFTCIVPGLYKFQMYSLTKSDTEVWFELYKNDVLVASVYGHNPNDFADAGNAVLLELFTGETVYLKAHEQHDGELFGKPDEVYATFTGVKLNNLPNFGKPPAFSVQLDHDETVISSHRVIFNKVLYNRNNNYNTTTGIYTVPASGIYIFHVFALSKTGEEIELNFYADRTYLCSLYGYTRRDYSDAGISVILYLRSGQHISLETARGDTSRIYGRSEEIFSSFTGAMLADVSSLQGTGGLIFPNKSTFLLICSDVSYMADARLTQGFVGFSAGLNRGYAVAGNSKVVYNKVFTNIGNGYHAATGTFTAPVSGLYEFTYHGLGERDATIWLELYHNTKYVNSLYSHTSDSYPGGGNAAVLQLNSGDSVFIKAHAHHTNNLYGRSDEVYSTFSGYLIGRTAHTVTVG